MTDTLTYTQIQERIAASVKEATPAFPKDGTADAWEEYADELRAIDVHDVAHAEIESWDWTIYTHYGMQIINVMSSSELNDAEAAWHDSAGVDGIDGSFGVYEFAAQVAYHYLLGALTSALETAIEELEELAEASAEAANS